VRLKEGDGFGELDSVWVAWRGGSSRSTPPCSPL